MKMKHVFPASTLCLALLGSFTTCILAQTNVTLVGHVNDGGTAEGVALSGHYAFVANGSDGLRSYDIEDPTNPVSIGHINDGNSAESVTIVGHIAYLADANDGLRVYDISDPTNIVDIGHTNNGNYAYRIVATTNTCYLGTLSGNLFVYDVSNPTNPSEIGHTNMVVVYGMALQGNYLYAANGQRGLYILNVSDPANPIIVYPPSPTFADTECVALQGNYAFVGSAESGLTVYDVSDPSNPTLIGTGTGGNPIDDVVISGNYAYVATANATSDFVAYNITVPANVALMTQVDTGANANGLAVADGYAYIADDSNGLLVYSLGQSTSPQLSIAQADASHVVVSWPAPTAAFALQENANLTTKDWMTTTSSPTVAGNSNQILLPLSGGSNFYRLESQ
jgi:hypothetical protein